MNKFIVAAMAVLLLVFLGIVFNKHQVDIMTSHGAEPPEKWQSWDDAVPGNPSENVVQVSPKTEPAPAPVIKLPAPKTYAEALVYAKTKNKKLLVVFKTDYCPACKRLDADTFSNAAVLKALREKEVTLIYYVNPDKEPAVFKKYQVRAVPAYWLLDGNETKLKSALGYKDPTTFIAWLNGK
jgi:thioredoxin-related protein